MIAITTRTGKTAIEKLLLNGGGWDQLRKTLEKKGLPIAGALAFGASDSIRVIGDGSRDFEDISTLEESGASADFLLGVLRQYTEQPDTEIVTAPLGQGEAAAILSGVPISQSAEGLEPFAEPAAAGGDNDAQSGDSK